MVRLCSFHYPKLNEELYQHYYDQYSYELHDFQKWCVEGVVTGNHVLITAPTGTGKTFGGEFAIHYMRSIGKKVIYCSPIKALSNEKFYAFTQKYSDISIGLITGDIKTNPDADVLIMTTEILLNKLYQLKSNTSAAKSSVSFDMDIDNELGCVVFDEIHFINDEHRGHVWEQTIMMLPSHIQMVGLSATLDNPEKFAQWLETKGNPLATAEKEVFLTRKEKRAVPLIHYSFITVTNSINKCVKDKALQEEIKRFTNQPFVIQNEKNEFNDVNYQNTVRMLKLFEKYDVRVKRPFVLNKVAEYLVQHEQLPAMCYVFSRKQLELCAEEMTTNLLEFDSKVPYTVDRECEQILRKLPNYEEYLHLPEYQRLVKMLRKGVAIHHAGMVPVFREIVELLFARGFIKLIFCTETMSVGINLPIKTVIFTDVNKFNGDVVRMLYSHEYTQASGRSGRLGLDKVGHVIHLNNLFRNVDSVSYKQMMNGKPPTLTSKFKISYNLLLNLIAMGDARLVQFASKSMVTTDLESQMREIQGQQTKLQAELQQIQSYVGQLRTPVDAIQELMELRKSQTTAVNKKRKEIDRRIAYLTDVHKFITADLVSYTKIAEKENQIHAVSSQFDKARVYIETGVERVLRILQEYGFVSGEKDTPVLTDLGKIAAQIRELHCLVFANLYNRRMFDGLSSAQLVALFSCFTSVRAGEEFEDYQPSSPDASINTMIETIREQYITYANLETQRQVQTGIDYDSIQYDLLPYIGRWCEATTAVECKHLLQELESEKGIFLGEVVKALLKINNIASEFEKIAEMNGDIALLNKLQEIPSMTLKFVVTNQSLYV
ncbi:MAG: DEAD/DEAH box helicase [Flavobacterium sp.]